MFNRALEKSQLNDKAAKADGCIAMYAPPRGAGLYLVDRSFSRMSLQTRPEAVLRLRPESSVLRMRLIFLPAISLPYAAI